MLKEKINVAVPTVFDNNEELNIKETLKHIQNLYNMGIRSVLISGTTGEQHSLTLNEKIKIIESLNTSHIVDNMEVIFGISSVRQRDVEKLAYHIKKTKISAILLGYPPYITPTQDEAFAYSEKIIEICQKPTILYNNPNKTSFDLSEKNIITLSKNDLVIGLKEDGDKNKVKHIKNSVKKDFIFYCGGELDLEEKVEMGYNALSSIAGNVYPIIISNWFNKLVINGHNPEGSQKEIQKIRNKIYDDNSIINVKKLLSLGICRSPIGICEK